MGHTSVAGMDAGRSGRIAEQDVQIIGCCECHSQTVHNPNYNAAGGQAKPPASGDWQKTDGGRWLCPTCAIHGTHKDHHGAMAGDSQAGNGAGQIQAAAGRDDRGDLHGAGTGWFSWG
jgi:hypothetical protein